MSVRDEPGAQSGRGSPSPQHQAVGTQCRRSGFTGRALASRRAVEAGGPRSQAQQAHPLQRCGGQSALDHPPASGSPSACSSAMPAFTCALPMRTSMSQCPRSVATGPVDQGPPESSMTSSELTASAVTLLPSMVQECRLQHMNLRRVTRQHFKAIFLKNQNESKEAITDQIPKF